MSLSRFNPEKPLALTAVCIIGLINASQMIQLIMSPVAQRLGEIYPAYFTVSAIISLVCIAGLWFLKRWAAVMYIIILLGNQIALAKMGYWEASAAVVSIVIIGILLRYWQRLVPLKFIGQNKQP